MHALHGIIQKWWFAGYSGAQAIPQSTIRRIKMKDLGLFNYFLGSWGFHISLNIAIMSCRHSRYFSVYLILAKYKYKIYIKWLPNTFSLNHLWSIKMKPNVIFKSQISSTIDYKINIKATFFSNYKIKEFVRKLSLVFLRNLILTIFIFKSVCVIITIETRKLNKSITISIKKILWIT